MAQVVCRCDRDECAEEVGVDGRGACAAAVEMECEEADGEVQGFAWDFVPVDEGAPVSVDGD